MSSSCNSIKILVVDDVASNRILLRKILNIVIDCEIIEAESGSQAIEICNNLMPDLILMDINMPDIDGYHTTLAIKKLVGSNYVPIIFVTANTEDTSLTQALSSGGDDFISKPFNARVLESKIKAHLRIRELNLDLIDKNNQLSNQQMLIERFFDKALEKSFLDERMIKYHLSSMCAFNGDVLLVETTPDDRVLTLVGDFTGHGLTAAMGTLPVSMIFFKMVQKGVAITEIVSEINSQLNKLLPSGMFFAASLVEIDIKHKSMKVWAGGMPDLYWFSKSGELKGEIQSNNMPLGILKDVQFSSATVDYSIETGDMIYLYSDGIIEATHNAEMFGSERLKSALLSHSENRFTEVLTEFNEFTGDAAQNDDVTLIELTCIDLQ